MAADDTVILRDVAEVQRVAADRIDASTREYHGGEVADLRAELVWRGRRIADLEELLQRCERDYNEVGRERDALAAELRTRPAARMFCSVDGVANWIAKEFERLGCRVRVTIGAEGRTITAHKNLAKPDATSASLVVLPASRGLAWISTGWSRGMDAELVEIAASGGFSATDRDGTWCVGVVGGGAS